MPEMLDGHDLHRIYDEEGNLVGSSGEEIWCDSPVCEARAQFRIVVSVNGPHDQFRNYCSGCYDVFVIGVQHGRWHEATLHGDKPGRDSFETPPKPRKRKS